MLIFINKLNINTATNHQSYWEGAQHVYGGGGRSPVPLPLVTALYQMLFHSFYTMNPNDRSGSTLSYISDRNLIFRIDPNY